MNVFRSARLRTYRRWPARFVRASTDEEQNQGRAKALHRFGAYQISRSERCGEPRLTSILQRDFFAFFQRQFGQLIFHRHALGQALSF
jgi:hypothetical protein